MEVSVRIDGREKFGGWADRSGNWAARAGEEKLATSEAWLGRAISNGKNNGRPSESSAGQM
jgi:hypothetical protein